MAFIHEDSLPTHQDDFNLDLDQTLDDAVDFLSSSDVEKLLSSSPSLDSKRNLISIETPPSSATRHSQHSTSSAKKRVDWAPFTNWGIGWASNAGPEMPKENASQSLLRRLQPSKERSLVRSKSILKASKSLGNEQEAQMQAPRSWSQVLDYSCIKLRANNDPSINLDTWRHMQQVLKDSTGLDLCLHELQYNDLLTYARRDIQYVAEKEEENAPPNQLPNAALKFLSIFVRLQDVKPQLRTQECAALVDVTIAALGNSKLPKSVTRCHLDFLFGQEFNAEVMTPDRIRKTIKVLQPLDKNHGSSCIMIDRVKVYRRFIQQYPEAMAARASQWLGNLIKASLSCEAGVFKLAVDSTFHAALELGHRKEVLRAMEDFLKEKNEHDETYLEIFCKEMTKKADPTLDVMQAMLVPKLVSTVFLFLRAKGPFASLGNDYGRLLAILKPYFDKNNARLAPPAYNALCWLIVAETANGRWPIKPIRKLRSAIEPQLTKTKKALDFSRGVPLHAFSTYITLLYCTFQPDVQDEHTRTKWDLTVAEIIPSMLDKSPAHGNLACQILCTLFSSEAPYNPHQFEEPKKSWGDPVLELGDLPRLSPSWIRANLQTVLKLVEKVLQMQNGSDESVAVWSGLMDAVAVAASKEIVITRETKNAIAQITNFLTAFWDEQVQSQEDAEAFVRQLSLFGRLLDLTFTKIGSPQDRIAIFTEKFLKIVPGDGIFEVASTPSHRPSMLLQSPVSHFLGVLMNAPSRRTATEQISRKVSYELSRDISDRFWQSRTTRVAKLSFLSELARTLTKSYRASPTKESIKHLDDFSAHILGLAVETFYDSVLQRQTSTAERLWDVYEHLVTVISEIALYTTVPAESLAICYKKIKDKALTELGATGVFTAIEEPCANRIHQFLQNTDQAGGTKPRSNQLLIAYAEVVIRTATKPGNSRALLKALEKLGRATTSLATPNFEKLHQMASSALQYGYHFLLGTGKAETEQFAHLISSTLYNLKTHNMTCMNVLKKGLAVVLKDKQGKIFGPEGDEICVGEVHKLWQFTINELKATKQNDQKFLTVYDDLIAAGLTSLSSYIVNECVVYWNERFGDLLTLVYPPLVAKALRQLRPLVDDLVISSWLPREDENNPDSPLVIKSTEDPSVAEVMLAPPTPLLRRQVPKITVSPSPANPRRINATPKSKSKAKLRHDDSQIQFEAIVSSPIHVDDPDLLTDRQREVLERQRSGTNTQALFAEISSPVAKRMRELSTDLPDDVEQFAQAPATPTLAPALDDGLPSSSPVVQSVKRREVFIRRAPPAEIGLGHGLLEDFADIPSSPPAPEDEAPAPAPVVTLHEPSSPDPIEPRVTDQPPSLSSFENARMTRTSQPSKIVVKDDAGVAVRIEPNAAVKREEVVASTIDEEVTPQQVQEVATQAGQTERVPAQVNPSTSLSTAADIESHQGELTQSRSSRVLETFIEQGNQFETGGQTTMDSIEANQDNNAGSKRRKRRGTAFVSSKKRKSNVGDDYAYNTTTPITITKKIRHLTPPDMLDDIAVRIPGQMEIEEVQVPATATKSRGRPRKSMDAVESSILDNSQRDGSLKRKRGRPSKSSQEILPQQEEPGFLPPIHTASSLRRSASYVEPPQPRGRQSSRLSQNMTNDPEEEQEEAVLQNVTPGSRKRRRTGPSTPRSRSASVHYVEVTPGDKTGRRASMTARTDTPEIEEMMAMSQQEQEREEDASGAEARASVSPVMDQAGPEDVIADSQNGDAQVGGTEQGEEPQVHIDDDDSVLGDSSARPQASGASSPGSQASQGSQNSFSASAFIGVISRFAEQAKRFISGGRPQEASAAVDRIVDEARKGCEKMKK